MFIINHSRSNRRAIKKRHKSGKRKTSESLLTSQTILGIVDIGHKYSSYH